MKLQITLAPLPVRGPDAFDVSVEVLGEDSHWYLEVSRDFWQGENKERAVGFILGEIKRLLSEGIEGDVPMHT